MDTDAKIGVSLRSKEFSDFAGKMIPFLTGYGFFVGFLYLAGYSEQFGMNVFYCYGVVDVFKTALYRVFSAGFVWVGDMFFSYLLARKLFTYGKGADTRSGQFLRREVSRLVILFYGVFSFQHYL